MSIELTQKEKRYLVKIIGADMVRMDHEADHAACHGTEVILPDSVIASDIQMYLLNDWQIGENEISDL